MKRYRWNKRKCFGNLAELATMTGMAALLVWMIYRAIMLGGAA